MHVCVCACVPHSWCWEGFGPLVIQADGDEQKPASRAEKAAAVLAQVTAGVKQEVEMAEASRAEKAAARLAQITAVAQQEFEMAEANKKNENG